MIWILGWAKEKDPCWAFGEDRFDLKTSKRPRVWFIRPRKSWWPKFHTPTNERLMEKVPWTTLAASSFRSNKCGLLINIVSVHTPHVFDIWIMYFLELTSILVYCLDNFAEIFFKRIHSYQWSMFYYVVT